MKSLFLLITVPLAGAASAATLPSPLTPANFAYRAFAGDQSSQVTVDAGNATLEVQDAAQSNSAVTVPSFFPFPDSEDVVSRQAIARVEGFGAPQPQVIASVDANVKASTTAPVDQSYRPRRINESANASSRLIYEFRIEPTGLFGSVGDLLPIDITILASFTSETLILGNPTSVTRASASTTGLVYLTEGTVSRVGTQPTADASDVIFEVFSDGVEEFEETGEAVLEAGTLYSITKFVSASASVLTETQPRVAGEVSASAQAILDPILSFNQTRFDAFYGDDCLAFFGSECPSVNELYSIAFAPGIQPVVAPIPLPTSGILLASVIGLLGFGSARRI